MSSDLSLTKTAIVGVPQEFMPGIIPPEAGFVIGQLLLCSTDENTKTLGSRIMKAHPLSMDVPGNAYEAMLLRLPINKEQPIKRMPPNPADYKQISPESVAEWFGYNGPLTRLLPNYEPRNEQVEMACKVASAFNGTEHLVVEAGTGIGKTMAYLVPSALWSMANSLPVVISTNTKNLQSQIFEKDLPIIREALHKKLRYSVIKGRSNYVCLSRIADVLGNIETEIANEQILGLAYAAAWLFRTNDGDLSKAPTIVYCDNGANRLFSTPEECRGRKCPYYSRCFLQRARVQSQNSDIVITNHSVYFSEPSDRPLALPQHAHVIFDEAHNLEEAATRKFLREVTPLAIMLPIRRLYTKTRTSEHGLIIRIKKLFLTSTAIPETSAKYRDDIFAKLNELIDLLGKVRIVLPPYLRQLEQLIPSQDGSIRLLPDVKYRGTWQDAEPLLNKVLDTLYEINNLITGISGSITSELERCKEQLANPAAEESPLMGLLLSLGQSVDSISLQFATLVGELAQYGGTFSELLSNIEFITELGDRQWVYWIERTGARSDRGFAVSLHAAPISIARFLADGLYACKDSVILCSATMNVAGSAAFISHRIGLDLLEPDRITSFVAGSPFDFKKQCRVLAPTFLPDPSERNGDEKYAKEFAPFMRNLLCLTQGRTLVLFTSYRLMQLCAKQLEAELAIASAEGVPHIRVLVQGTGASRETLTQQFKDESQASVLMGTDSFWEGVDLIGDALTALVIVKLPFDAVNDPIVNARAEQVRQETGDSFMGYSVPNAVIKFRQGFGRLIRHKHDRGVVVITDPRLITKNYGGMFRRSIPASVERIPTIDQFQHALEEFFLASAYGKPPMIAGNELES